MLRMKHMSHQKLKYLAQVIQLQKSGLKIQTQVWLKNSSTSLHSTAWEETMTQMMVVMLLILLILLLIRKEGGR